MNSDQVERKLNILLVDDDPEEYRLMKLILKNVKRPLINLEFVSDIGAAIDRVKVEGIDIVFLDNRLLPNKDFRETAPQLRKAGFIGPIGIVSSDISGSYFQEFREFGVDFRISKDEIDSSAISFIIAEYTRDQLSDNCAEDYT